jgi:hypothetical protein
MTRVLPSFIASRRAFRAALLALALAGVVVPAGPAGADTRNPTFYGGAASVFETHRDEGGGQVGMWDVEVRRSVFGPFSQICDYQAKVTVRIPNGFTYVEESPFEGGCRFWGVPARRFLDQFGDEARHDSYPKGSVVTGYWKDNHTDGEYKEIGRFTL